MDNPTRSSSDAGTGMVGVLAEVLGEHRQEEQRLTTIDGNPWKYTGVYRCECGVEYPSLSIMGGSFVAHRLHVAHALAAALGEREREAWADGFDLGHQYARAVNAEYPERPANPYRGGA